MPVLTPNFSLPVPGPLDAPCDFAQQWCDFTDSVQAVLDGFEAIANRTNPVVPLAKMELLHTVSVPSNSFIPFDTLTLNNAGMVNFDANNTSIVINRPGRFFAVVNVLFVADTFFPNSNYQIQFFPIGAGTVTITPGYETDLNASTTINVGAVASAVFYVTTPPLVVSPNVLIASTNPNVVMDLASFQLFWYADRETP